MKFLASAIVLLSSTVALAFPAVGDQASFAGTYTTNGSNYAVGLTMSLLQFNASTNQYLQNEVQTVNGQSQAKAEWVDASEMITNGMISDLLANCEAYQGRRETVSVTAGTFETCAMSSQGDNSHGVTWVGMVPFGVVKMTQTAHDNSFTLSAELQSFRQGN